MGGGAIIGGTHAAAEHRRARHLGGRHRAGGSASAAAACSDRRLQRLVAQRGSRSAAAGARAGEAAGALLQVAELPLDPVEVQVDLPLVVAAEAHPEDDVMDLLGGRPGAPIGSPASVASTRSRKASTSSTLYPRRSARRRNR